MYDPAVTTRYLSKQQQATPTFQATRYARADIDAMIALLAEAYDPDTQQQTRRLTDEERTFIHNEQLLCAHDFHHYFGNYFHLKDFETERLIRPTLNLAQRIVVDAWSEMERNYVAIMMMELKARRLGLSSVTAAAVANRVQFHGDTAALIASSTPAKSMGLAKMMRDAWDNMPWWLMPPVSVIQDGCPVEFRSINTTLSIQAGNQFTGIGRGASPTVIWLSEVCEWRDPYADIDSSLVRSILETPRTFFVLESTALGRGNWYHHHWKTSKDKYGKFGTQFYPLFLPWYVGRDIYPTESWLRRNGALMHNWTPDDHLLAYANRCAEFVHAHERLRRFLGDGWVLPKEQLWWYYCTREEYKQNNNVNQFYAECPSDDLDAFQSTNRSAFSQEVIQVYHDRIRPPLGTYKLIGVGASEVEIPPKLRPVRKELDPDRPPIDLPCDWGEYHGHFRLLPVKFAGSAAASADNVVFLYESPRPDFHYCFGVDCAEGIGQDNTVIEMVRKDTLTEPDEQVCEWASGYVSQMELWPWCMALGTLYSVPIGGERRQAKSAIEVTLAGDAVQWQLRLRGWSNHMLWVRALDNKKVDFSRMTKLGFVTNKWSRPYAIGLLLQYVNDEYLTINSPYFVEEMEGFSKEEDGVKIQAEYGEHDDRLMAMSFALFALHILEKKSKQLTMAEQRLVHETEVDPAWDGGYQGRSPLDPWAEGAGTSPRNWDILRDLYEPRLRTRGGR